MSERPTLSAQDERVLATISLDAHEWRGVQQLANALSEFEPLAKRGRLGMTVVSRLLAMAIAEQGPSSDRYIGRDMDVGYRLSELGWRIYDRGRWPRRG